MITRFGGGGVAVGVTEGDAVGDLDVVGEIDGASEVLGYCDSVGKILGDCDSVGDALGNSVGEVDGDLLGEVLGDFVGATFVIETCATAGVRPNLILCTTMITSLPDLPYFGIT